MTYLHKYVLLRLAYILLFPLLGEYGLAVPFLNAIESAGRSARAYDEMAGYPVACEMLNHYRKVITDNYTPGGESERALKEAATAILDEFIAAIKQKCEYPPPLFLLTNLTTRFLQLQLTKNKFTVEPQ